MLNRFATETKRQLDVLDQRLAQNRFIAGRGYSVADMAIFPWYGALVLPPKGPLPTFLSRTNSYTL
ncbi:glutathione S-transferase C-terminal domain-containing protein [Lichenifustis flavocetrariae]|uniref:glutathione S-transferase C-terminal domain-containing protein n=1 Tax=Lichenifustis flavocetrariae TaxID=2949735 RepID=UPI003D12E30F